MRLPSVAVFLVLQFITDNVLERPRSWTTPLVMPVENKNMIEPKRARFAKATIWIHPHSENENKPAQVDIFQWFGDIDLLDIAQKDCDDEHVFELVEGFNFDEELNVDLIFDYENGITGESPDRQYYVRFVNLA